MTDKRENQTSHEHPEHSHTAEVLSGAALALAALGVTGAVIHGRHKRQRSQASVEYWPDSSEVPGQVANDPTEIYRQSAAILNDERLNKRTQWLVHLNRLAALVLTGHTPTRDYLQKNMPDLNDTTFASVLGFLRAKDGLVESRQREDGDTHIYYYAPTQALLWAAEQPDEYKLLAASIEELAAENRSEL